MSNINLDDIKSTFKKNIKSVAINNINNLFWLLSKQYEFKKYLLVIDDDISLSTFGNISDQVFIEYGNKIKKQTDIFTHDTSSIPNIPNNIKLQLDSVVSYIISDTFGDKIMLIIEIFDFSVGIDIVNLDDIDTSTSQIEDYLSKYNILKNDKNQEYEITIHKDPGCNMAWVKINNVQIFAGNSQDFHNGCYGCKLPSFYGVHSYANVIKSCLVESGYNATVNTNTYHEEYNY